MDKDFWTPKFEDGESTSGSETMAMGGLALSKSDAAEKKMVMPVVGDKMRFIVYPYGQLHLVDKHTAAQEGQNVIEVEVIAAKKVHVSYE